MASPFKAALAGVRPLVDAYFGDPGCTLRAMRRDDPNGRLSVDGTRADMTVTVIFLDAPVAVEVPPAPQGRADGARFHGPRRTGLVASDGLAWTPRKGDRVIEPDGRIWEIAEPVDDDRLGRLTMVLAALNAAG